jgi:two-component system chemotaxis response regulator CheY
MNLTLLVVDDSKISRKVNMTTLREVLGEQIRCIEAVSGEDALATLAVQKVDLMVLDLTMPGMSGYDVLTAVKTRGIKVRTIVISADIQPLAKERVLQLGAIAFIQKPLSVESLKSELERQGVIHG